MRFITDRKRALGMGSAKSGTEHFWEMKVSSVALLILIPLFVFTFGSVVGEPHDVVVAYFVKPFPALITGLTLIVGFAHFKSGATVLIAWHGAEASDHIRDMLIVSGDGNRAFCPCKISFLRGLR